MSDETLAWVDIETFGFDPDWDPIIEVGLVITDLDLEVVDGFHSVLVWDAQQEVKHNVMATRHMPQSSEAEWVWKTHNANNLFTEAQKAGVTFDLAEEMLCDVMERYKGTPMVGSSIHFDRGHLKSQMPDFESMFHYRNIDISTLKELCRRLNLALYAKLDNYTGKQEKHRVMPDLEDSLQEARFYFDNFLFQER